MKKTLAILLSAVMMLGLLAGCGNSAAAGSTAAGTYTAGTYSATATGINTTTPVTVTMTFNADTITDVQIDVANETKGYGADIADEMVKKILDAQSSHQKGCRELHQSGQGRGRCPHRGQQG